MDKLSGVGGGLYGCGKKKCGHTWVWDSQGVILGAVVFWEEKISENCRKLGLVV